MSDGQNQKTETPDCGCPPGYQFGGCVFSRQMCNRGEDRAEHGTRRHSAALRAAAFALYPIMEREGMDDLARASAGELARTAIEEYERVMAGGEIRG